MANFFLKCFLDVSFKKQQKVLEQVF